MGYNDKKQIKQQHLTQRQQTEIISFLNNIVPANRRLEERNRVLQISLQIPTIRLHLTGSEQIVLTDPDYLQQIHP